MEFEGRSGQDLGVGGERGVNDCKLFSLSCGAGAEGACGHGKHPSGMSVAVIQESGIQGQVLGWRYKLGSRWHFHGSEAQDEITKEGSMDGTEVCAWEQRAL